MVQVKYTQKDIYERVFKQKWMGVGYDPQDVDDFLDDIINDYGIFNERIEELQAEVGQLQTALKHAQTQLAEQEVTVKEDEAAVAAAAKPTTTSVVTEDEPEASAQEQQEAPKQEAPANNATNLDLIKRVANLERAVFGRERS